MPRKKTPAEVAEKYSRRASAATPDYQAGIESVTEAPTAKAAKKVDKMRQNFNAAIDSGKVKRGLERVTLGEWKDAALTKGVNRYASGVLAAQGKVESFMSEFLPHLDKVAATVGAMPDLTLQDNINRMVKHVTMVADFKRTK